jgi:putative peptidoglycan lipid II flippase
MGPLKHGGLALATTISACGNMLLLLWFLRRKIGTFGGTRIVRCGLKSIAATVPMALLVQYMISMYDWSQVGHTFMKSTVLGAAVGTGILVYAACVRLLRSDEALDAISMIRKKLGR